MSSLIRQILHLFALTVESVSAQLLTAYVCVCVFQSNYLVFMAELFWWVEVVKPSFVQPRVFDPDGAVLLH